MKCLIGFCGRELPDLKMSCCQIQVENISYILVLKKYINMSILTEEKNSPLKQQRSKVFTYQ